MKKMRILWGGLILVALAAVGFASSSNFTDFFTVNGRGTLGNTAIAWIDTNRDFALYDGDIYLGASGSTPSSSAFSGLKIPFYNASGSTMSQGSVVLASATATTAGYASMASVLSTTTVLGVCEGTVANAAVGWMTVSGYALVLTTGTVNIGDVLVSSNTSIGYAGRNTTPTSGTDIGVALSVGTSAGGLTLVRLR